MFIGELLRADRQREPGGGRFLRAGRPEPVPGRTLRGDVKPVSETQLCGWVFYF